MKLLQSLAGWCLVLLIVAVAAAAFGHGAPAFALEPGGLALPLVGAVGMIRIWGAPLDASGLQRLATPQAGDLESFPDIKYDRQTFPAAGGVANLPFFRAVAGPNVSNMEAAGQFPAPQWYQLFGICVTPMAAGPSNITQGATTVNSTGIQNDWDLLAKTQGAVVILSIAQKRYGPWPILAHHGLGGAMGFFTGQGSLTLQQQQVQNGPADGGFGPQGEVVIPPNVGFTVDIQLLAAQALSVATLVEVALVGRIYRAPR